MKIPLVKPVECSWYGREKNNHPIRSCSKHSRFSGGSDDKNAFLLCFYKERQGLWLPFLYSKSEITSSNPGVNLYHYDLHWKGQIRLQPIFQIQISIQFSSACPKSLEVVSVLSTANTDVCPCLSGTVPVGACCPEVIINSASFHVHDGPDWKDELRGHHIHVPCLPHSTHPSFRVYHHLPPRLLKYAISCASHLHGALPFLQFIQHRWIFQKWKSNPSPPCFIAPPPCYFQNNVLNALECSSSKSSMIWLHSKKSTLSSIAISTCEWWERWKEETQTEGISYIKSTINWEGRPMTQIICMVVTFLLKNVWRVELNSTGTSLWIIITQNVEFIFRDPEVLKNQHSRSWTTSFW